MNSTNFFNLSTVYKIGLKHLYISLVILMLSLLLCSGSVQAAILNANIVTKGSGPLTGDDAFSSAQPIGFTFSFFGVNHTQFYASTNGLIFFSNPSTTYSNQSTIPLNSIAVLWDDLKSYLGSKTPARDDYIFYKTEGTAPHRHLVIQWNNYGIYSSELQFGTMQAILFEGTNNIEFHYNSLLTPGRSDGGSGTVGLRGTGSEILHSRNLAVLTQGEFICWVKSGGSYTKIIGTSPSCPFTGTSLTNHSSPPPDKPVNLSRSNSTFSWNSVPHADSYRLIVSTHSNLNSPIYNQPGITSTSRDTHLTFTPGTHYFWAVSAHNNSGNTSSNVQPFTLHPPTGAPDTYSITHGGTLNVDHSGVLDNDTNAASAIKLSDPQHSAPGHPFNFKPDGTFVYVPDPAYSIGADFTDQFTYKAKNQSGESSSVTVTIKVNHQEHAPTATVDTYSTPEDTPLVVTASKGVLTNDHDIDVHDQLNAVIVTDTTHGTIKLNNDGSLTYTPDSNFNGSDSFTYKTNDKHQDSNTVTVTITVNAVSDAPVAQADAYTIAEDAILDSVPGVLDNDYDADGDSLTAVKLTDPSHGLLIFLADGNFRYIPDSEFNGDDSFTYHATDGKDSSSDVKVTIRVTPVNDPPMAFPDAYSVHEDTGLSIDVAKGLLHNDQDPENNPLKVNLVSNVTNGTLHFKKDGSFAYTPDLNYNGTDSFTYKTFDGKLYSNTVTVTLTIDAINDAPVAVTDSYTTMEETLLTVDIKTGLIVNDSDPDGDTLMALLGVVPAHGRFHFNPNGSFTYLPELNFAGSDSFTYKLNDGNLDSNTTTVNLTVRNVNDAPLAANDSYSTPEDTMLQMDTHNGILANDIDFDGDILKALLVTLPANGLVHLKSDGSFTYDPTGNFTGIDSFTYTAHDGSESSGVVTVSIVVSAVNDAPVAVDDLYSIGEGGLLKVIVSQGFLLNDYDVDSNMLRLSNLVTSTNNGVLSVTSDSSFTYKPNFGFFGTDTFTYKITDGTIDSNIATVTITVNHVNTPPLTNSDAYTITEDAVLQVAVANGLLTNDLDVNGDALLAVNIPTDVSHGTLQMSLDGSFTYTPTPYYHGTDLFTYMVSDGTVSSGPVMVALTITHINHAPLAGNDSFNLPQDTVLNVPPSGLLANDLDVDGDNLYVLIQSQPVHGTLHHDLDGGFVYSPAPGYQGTDSYTYMASDGQENSNVVTVSININHNNHIPLAAADSYSTARNIVLQVDTAQGVLNNDVDIDGDLLTAIIVSQPQHGTLHALTDGSFTYTPAQNYAGIDNFTYKATDGALESSVVSVAINVDFTNRPPVAADDSYNLPQDAVLTVPPSGLLANDTDADGDNLVAIIQNQPQHGVVHQDSDGGFVYSPAPGYQGTDSYTYMASDGQENSNVVTVSININHNNHIPLAAADSYSTARNIVLQVDTAQGVLNNDVDIDGDLLTAIIVSQPQHGTLHALTDGSFTYTPAQDYAGIDNFTYKATDGVLESSVVNVAINVNFTNRPPVAVDDNYNLPQDAVLTVPPSGLLTNDTDADGDNLFVLIQSQPVHGALHQVLDGGFVYSPASGYQGTDSYTYMASDGQENSNVVTVSININHNNHIPLAAADSYSTARNIVLQVDTAQGVLNNDVDIDGDLLTAIIVSQPQHGTLHALTDGSFTYTPAQDYAGIDNFTYKATDGVLESSVVNVAINVNFTNRPPVAVDDNNYSVPQDTALQIDAVNGVLSNDSDPDGDLLSAIIVTQPQHGTLNIAIGGGFTYRPDTGYIGPDSFTYKANDGAADSNIATASIEVTAAAAIPTLNEWGLIILSIVLTLIGVAVVRRREKDPYISL